MQKEIIQVKGVFNGLYEWGKGWSASASSIWNDFWREKRESKLREWFIIEDNSYGDPTFNIIQKTAGTSVYLHPMDIRFIMEGGGIESGKGGNIHPESEWALNELNQLCKEIAEKLGGTFELKFKKSYIPLCYGYDMDNFIPIKED